MRTVLSPRQLAEAIGVSESSVKRWVDDGRIAATRTDGGHRRIALEEAVRYIRRRRFSVLRPDLLGLSELAAAGAPEAGDDPGERLFGFLQAGAAAEARGLILSLYLGGTSVAAIVDGPLVHAMTRLGELWTASPSGIFWEHRATQIAFQALSRLRGLLSLPEGAPAAVGGAPAGDRYFLPSLAVATVLEAEGLRATNLGPESPLPTLAIAAEALEARLVWLSVSVADEIERLRRGVLDLAGSLASRGALLVVGGAAIPRLALPRADGLYVGRSMGELEALIQGMRLARGTEPRALEGETAGS